MLLFLLADTYDAYVCSAQSHATANSYVSLDCPTHNTSNVACRGSFNKDAAAAVMQEGDAKPGMLQDLLDACLVVPAAAASTPRYSMHPLVWDVADRERRQQPPADQLPALEAFLSWLLKPGVRLAQLQPGKRSAAELSESLQLLADELPNWRALAEHLGQEPLQTSDKVALATTLTDLRLLCILPFRPRAAVSTAAAACAGCQHQGADQLAPCHNPYHGGPWLDHGRTRPPGGGGWHAAGGAAAEAAGVGAAG